jgi:hypothetical protein
MPPEGRRPRIEGRSAEADIELFVPGPRRDARGVVFDLPGEQLAWLGRVTGMHFGTVTPGAVRGNHLHRQARELLLVQYRGAWELAWGTGESQPARRRRFSGDGCVGVRIPPGIAHAIRNTGGLDLGFVALTDAAGPGEAPDVVRRPLL